MVIDTNNINSAGGPRNQKTAAVNTGVTKNPPTAADAKVSSAKDEVSISSEAQSLTKLQAKIGELPNVNLERVENIKQAIAEGRFEINPERIAENMLIQDELFN
jgi:negative regulator of flagellin synthesis FlgM